MQTLTNNDLPVLHSCGDFVSATHFRKTDATHDEHNQTRDIFYSLLALVLVPVTVPCAEYLKNTISFDIYMRGK